MKQNEKKLGALMILIGLLITTQNARAQDTLDTMIQADAQAPEAIVAMAPGADLQMNQIAGPAIAPEPAANALAIEGKQMKTRNFEEAGNALGFILPAIAMAGLVILAML